MIAVVFNSLERTVSPSSRALSKRFWVGSSDFSAEESLPSAIVLSQK
jgi:hypothetical protein